MIKALEQGPTPKEVAKSFHFSLATIDNIRGLAKKLSNVSSLVSKRKDPKKTDL